MSASAAKYFRPKLGYAWYLFEPVAIFLLALIICYLYFRQPPFTPVQGGFNVWDAAVTVVATFLGATLAFLSEALRARSLRTSTHRTASHLAFFKLARMIERLENIKRQYVDPHRDDAAKILNMPASLPVDPDSPRLDFDSLAFMLDRHSDLLGELAVAEARYKSLLELFNKRSQFHLERVQSKLKEKDFPEKFQTTEAEVSALLGRGNFLEITNLTTQLIQFMDADIPELTALTNRFGNTLSEYFPDLSLKVEMVDWGAERPSGQ